MTKLTSVNPTAKHVSSWTTAHIEILAAMAAEGCSGGQIAAALGKTRNAVIGKMTRDKIAHRGRPLPKRKAKLQPYRIEAAQFKQDAPFIEDTPILEPTARNLTLLKLESNHCRFIPGEVKGAETIYCAADVIEGTSYCSQHFHTCWQRNTSRWSSRARA